MVPTLFATLASMSTPTVHPESTGAIAPDIIRRIVKAHIDEVRYCYNEGLAIDPTLAGRIVVRFTIDAEGSVGAAEVTESTLSTPAVGICTVGAVKRWKFPRPKGGGHVVVSYPFVLEPG